MAKYLDSAGVKHLWSKTTQRAADAINAYLQKDVESVKMTAYNSIKPVTWKAANITTTHGKDTAVNRQNSGYANLTTDITLVSSDTSKVPATANTITAADSGITFVKGSGTKYTISSDNNDIVVECTATGPLSNDGTKLSGITKATLVTHIPSNNSLSLTLSSSSDTNHKISKEYDSVNVKPNDGDDRNQNPYTVSNKAEATRNFDKVPDKTIIIGTNWQTPANTLYVVLTDSKPTIDDDWFTSKRSAGYGTSAKTVTTTKLTSPVEKYVVVLSTTTITSLGVQGKQGDGIDPVTLDGGTNTSFNHTNAGDGSITKWYYRVSKGTVGCSNTTIFTKG